METIRRGVPLEQRRALGMLLGLGSVNPKPLVASEATVVGTMSTLAAITLALERSTLVTVLVTEKGWGLEAWGPPSRFITAWIRFRPDSTKPAATFLFPIGTASSTHLILAPSQDWWSLFPTAVSQHAHTAS